MDSVPIENKKNADERIGQEMLAGVGRDINEAGGFNLEIKSDRTPEDIRHNRPGETLREKRLSLTASPGV